MPASYNLCDANTAIWMPYQRLTVVERQSSKTDIGSGQNTQHKYSEPGRGRFGDTHGLGTVSAIVLVLCLPMSALEIARTS